MTEWINRTLPQFWNTSGTSYDSSNRKWSVAPGADAYFTVKSQYRSPHPNLFKISFSGANHAKLYVYSIMLPQYNSETTSMCYDHYYRSGHTIPVIDVNSTLRYFSQIKFTNNSASTIYINAISISYDEYEYEQTIEWNEIKIIDSEGNAVPDSLFTGSKIDFNRNTPYVFISANMYGTPNTYKPAGAPNYIDMWGFAVKRVNDVWKPIYLNTVPSNVEVIPSIPGILRIGREFDACITSNGIVNIGSYIQDNDATNLLDYYKGFNIVTNYDYYTRGLLDYDAEEVLVHDLFGSAEVRSNHGRYPSMAIDSLNTVYSCFVGVDNTQIRIMKTHMTEPPNDYNTPSYPQMNTHKLVENLDAGYSFERAWIKIDKNDSIYVLYIQGNGGDSALKCIKNTTGVWGAAETLKTGSVYYTKICVDSVNVAHILVNIDSEWYHLWTSGDMWHEELMYVPSNFYGDDSNMIVDGNGAIHLFWTFSGTYVHYVQDGQYFNPYYALQTIGRIGYDNSEYISGINSVFYDVGNNTVHLLSKTLYTAIGLDDHITSPSISSLSSISSSSSLSKASKSSESSEYKISESSSSDSSSQSKDSKSSSLSPSSSWVQHCDDSDWSAVFGEWNGVSSRWESADNGGMQLIYVEASEDWTDGYRPTKMRLTFEIPGHANADFSISVDSSNDTIYSSSGLNAVSVESFECDLIFGGSASQYDIALMMISQMDGYVFYITNIEFLSEGSPSSSLSKASKSSSSESSRSCSHSKISWSSDSLSVSSISWRREIAAIFKIIENTNVSLSSSESSQSIRSFPKGY